MYLATSFFSRTLKCVTSNSLRYYTNNAAKLGTIDFEALKAGLENKNLTYIDVRNKSELQREGKVVGSVNIPLPEVVNAFDLSSCDFQEKYGFVKPEKTDTNLVLGCLYAKRSTEAGLYLQKIGYKTIVIYTGGFDEWKAKDGPINK